MDFFCKVTPINSNEKLNSVQLKIDIDRGKKARIKEIQF